jgi:hypothetical protein
MPALYKSAANSCDSVMRVRNEPKAHMAGKAPKAAARS